MSAITEFRSLFQELILVVGPTQDDTHLVLADYQALITQIIFTDRRNVSVARNLGLRAASQDIVLYLDDDVIPSVDWLIAHMQAHQAQNTRCGCVAGAVADQTRPGAPLQFARGVHNHLSESHPVLSAEQEQHYLQDCRWFRGVMGANASYQRLALLKTGGFDEFYEYFLEETDMCLRLLNAGYTVQRIDCTVEHYVQPSHNRRDRRHLTCWYAIAKNTTYFALKHGPKDGRYSLWFLTRLAGLLTYRCFLRILRLQFTHHLPHQLVRQYLGEAIAGIRQGWQAGLQFHSAQPVPCSQASELTNQDSKIKP